MRGGQKVAGLPVAGVLFALCIVLASSPSADAQSGEEGCNPPNDGAWLITNAATVVCENRAIYVRNVMIRGGSSLTFRNVDFKIHAPTSDPTQNYFGIDSYGAPGTGANFEAHDSSFGVDGPGGYGISAGAHYANLKILRSTFTGNVAIVVAPGAGDVLVQDSHFIDVPTPIGDFATLTERGVFRFIGNFLEYPSGPHGSEAIYIEGDPIIENNVVVGCPGIIDFRYNAKPVIRHNTFTGCLGGIHYGSTASPPQVINDNDIFAQGPRGEAGAGAEWFGNGENNWWGEDPPATTAPAYFDIEDYTPWRTSPVHPERLPTATFSISGSSIRGQTMSFDASASQPRQALRQFGDYELEAFEWDFGDDTIADGKTATHAFQEPGSYAVKMRVVDGKGLSRMAKQTVTIPNASPSAVASISPSQPAPNQMLVASVTTSDPEQDAVTVTGYTWQRNGVVQGDLTGNAVPQGRAAAGEQWRVTVAVKDKYGAQATSTASVTVSGVQNAAPGIDSVSISPSAPRTDEALTATASGYDPDGQAVSYRYAWKRNGELQSSLTGATVPADRTTRGETWTVTATPNDGITDGQAQEASVTIQNTAPRIHSASAQPSPAVVGQQVTFSVQASDIDADALTVTWTMPGGATATGSSTTATFQSTGSKTASYVVSDGTSSRSGTVTVTVNAASSTTTSSTPPGTTSTSSTSSSHSTTTSTTTTSSSTSTTSSSTPPPAGPPPANPPPQSQSQSSPSPSEQPPSAPTSPSATAVSNPAQEPSTEESPASADELEEAIADGRVAATIQFGSSSTAVMNHRDGIEVALGNEADAVVAHAASNPPQATTLLFDLTGSSFTLDSMAVLVDGHSATAASNLTDVLDASNDEGPEHFRVERDGMVAVLVSIPDLSFSSIHIGAENPSQTVILSDKQLQAEESPGPSILLLLGAMLLVALRRRH